MDVFVGNIGTIIMLFQNKYKKIKLLFGNFSHKYDDHMESTNHIAVQRNILTMLVKYIGYSVCDIAAGTGQTSKIISSLKAVDLTLVDFQGQMLDIAKKKFLDHSSVDFITLDVHEIDKLNRKFDTIVCSFGCYWFKNQRVVIENIGKCLNNNGKVILLEEHFYDSQQSLPVFSHKGGTLEHLALLENYIGITKLIDLCSDAGLKLIEHVKHPIDEFHQLDGLVFM